MSMLYLVVGVVAIRATNALSDYKLWPIPKTFEIGYQSPLCRISIGFRYSIGGISNVSGHATNVQAALAVRNGQLEKLFSFGGPNGVSSDPACAAQTCVLHIASLSAGMTQDTASESYEIKFNAQGCSISCPTVYGCMHGMVTFTQMIDPLLEYRVPVDFRIADQPGYPHRGVMLDTSRHYLSEEVIGEHLELMAESKMNVLHWHLVDDHSFPLVLNKYPELAEKGAYGPKAVYSEKCVSRILAKAGSLGIKVVPEVDMPGHTWSWFKSHPELQGNARGAIDPSRAENYTWIKNFLRELIRLFSHPTRVSNELLEVHLGADETWGAWSTPAIQQWMTNQGITSKSQLVKYWFQNILDSSLQFQPIVWEDFVAELTPDDLASVSEKVIWQFWSTNDIGRINGLTLSSISKPVIFSSPLYLDHLGLNWASFYSASFPQRSAGGEACMWSEWVDDSNVISRTWPRSAALGERLWIGGEQGGSAGQAVSRLAKWRCRMVAFFGHPRVEPVGQIGDSNPETWWTWNTDKNQWWCPEQGY